MNLKVTHPQASIFGSLRPPGSKSESNRALILKALSGGLVEIEGLSCAKDSLVLEQLLRTMPETMDVGHAGTAMRFLSAYLSFIPRDTFLTGSSRMQERPIGPLVEALREMGAEIAYLGKEGYPPLMIFGKNAKFRSARVRLPGNVSSQYISALLLIACQQPDGLEIEIEGKLMSRPYVEMTLELLSRFGIQHSWEGNVIKVAKQHLRAGRFEVEADWSAASYWFCMAALAKEAEIVLKGLRQESLQGDSVVTAKMSELGIESSWQAQGLCIRRVGPSPSSVNWDFSDCPDLAQGLIVVLAALGINGTFTGLESLRIKETDRIAALQAELGKYGVLLKEEEDQWWLEGHFEPKTALIGTYQDHRMAMAFAPLALVCPAVVIEDAGVVDKSYPDFWAHLVALGFQISMQ